MDDPKDNTDIHIACENGDWKKFRVLVNSGVNQFEKYRTSLLHYASGGGRRFIDKPKSRWDSNAATGNNHNDWKYYCKYCPFNTQRTRDKRDYVL